jgi:3-(3-hydroxy-phenyl)propionate hydroxylase
MEEYLLDACQANPLIDFRWGNKVVGVEQESGFARVSIDTSEGVYQLETDWVVAADGGRSSIRSGMNLLMEGASYEGFFVIADIKIDLPLPTERLAYFDPDWNPGNTILMHREPHGIWRVDYQLPAGETPEDALKPESLKQRIDAQLAMIGHAGAKWEMDWCSVYSARTLTLPDYVQGRVIFTGDAAHLLPIFGVRGANTGFQDAQSLAWHLAFVVKGLASEKLLANHSAERVGAAREIIDEAGKSTRFMAPPSRGFRLLRDAVLSLSLTEEFVRPLYHWRTSRPHEYTHSMLNSTGDDNALFKSGPAHGAPPQNIRLAPNDFLLDHLGGGFDLLYFTDAAAIPKALQEVVEQTRARGVPLKVIAVGAAQPVAGADLTLADADGHFRQRYGVLANGGAYLMRPDQHVCARWLTLDATRLQAALQTALPQ